MLKTFNDIIDLSDNFSDHLKNQGLSFDPSYFKANKEVKKNLLLRFSTSVCNRNLFVFNASDETLNRGPLALLLRRQYEFPFGINIVQFSIFIQRVSKGI